MIIQTSNENKIAYNFIGEYSIIISEHNQITIPPSFVKQGALYDKFIIKKDDDYRCLAFYPIDVWNNLIECLNKTANNKNTSKDFKELQKRFSKDIYSIKFKKDSHSFNIPKHLWKFINNENNLVLVGLENKFELWPQKTYTEYLKHYDQSDNDMKKMAEHILSINTDFK